MRASTDELLLADAALPSLSRLLNAESFADAVESATGLSCSVTARWFRWSPASAAAVLYDVNIGGAKTLAVATVEAGTDPHLIAASPEARRIADASRDRCAVSEPIHALRDLGALLEWYPAALRLPGLAAAAAKDAELVVYRPAQRAVLRAGDLFWKAYASPKRFARAVEAMDVAARIRGVRVPELVSTHGDERLTAQRALEGEHLPGTPEARAAIGEALRRVHTSSVRPARIVTAADHLAGVRKIAARLIYAAPWLSARVDMRVERLAESMPAAEDLVPAHGDFHAGQALSAARGEAALLDFDALMLTGAAFDFGRFVAHEIAGPEDLDAAWLRARDLAAGYGRLPEELTWYLGAAVLRRVLHPLRRLDRDWAARTERLLEASEAVAG